jgi:CHAT domain-containing protein
MRLALLSAGILSLAGAAANAQATRALAPDLTGETCTANGSLESGDTVSIVCGNPAGEAGTLTATQLPPSLPSAAPARRAALTAELAAENGGLTCPAPDWVGGGDQAVQVCKANGNGLSRVVVATVVNGTLYRAEGLPTALPALQSAVAQMSGSPTAFDQNAALQAMRAHVPPEQMKASASDYATYAQYIEKGRLAGAAKDFAAAENDYRQALLIETRLFGANAFVVGETLSELALQVSNQGRFGEAADLFQRATPIIESSASADARARLASYRALDAANRRDFADALKYARESTAARRAEIAQAQSGPNSPPVSRGELAHSLRIESAMALRLGDLAGARAAGEEALWIVSDDPGLPLWWRPDMVSLMGEVNEADGRVVNAEQNFRDARDLDQKLFGDTTRTALADLRLGQFYSEQQLYAPAVDAYRAGFAILAKDPVGRAQIVPDQIVPYVAAMRATNGDDADVFRTAQLTASSLADQTIARVAARQATSNAQLSDLIREAQDAEMARDTARVDLAAETAKSDDQRNAAREDKLQNDVKLASARADDLSGKVQQQFPDYAKLVSAAPADLKDVQSRLGPREALLSYVIGARSSYALLVTHDSFTAAPLEVKEADLSADVSDLRRAFAPKLGRLPDFSLSTSHTLYKELLAPLEPKLAGIDHLIVAPNSTLANLPFALLVTEAPTRGGEHNYGRAAWLIRRMAVSDVPSPRAFVALRTEAQHRVAAARPFLGLGNPAFAGAKGPAGAKALALLADSCREDTPVSAELLRSLPPLPDTAKEVQTVGARFGGGTLLMGGQATEAALRAQPLDQYATLYFATHGLLPGELHCASEPSLALSPPSTPATSTQTDGLLTASEIAQLKLNADLVVLSACNTGLSASGPGGGSLEGLADSFFAAGARGVLATEWEVPSASTTKLMVGVFDRAHGSADVAEALRQAQLALIANGATSHPFHWAAFTLIGGGGSPSNVSADAAQPKGGRS